MMSSDTWLIALLSFPTVYILFTKSAKFRYIVKFGYLFGSYIAMTPILALLCLPWARNPQNGAFISKLMKPINKVIGVSWSLEGAENLRCESGAVVLLNHQSVIDVIALFEIWPHLRKAVPIAKRELLYSGGLFGVCCWLVGTVFIDRTSATSRDAVNDAGKRAMTTGTKLMIFPEGTRNGAKGLKLLPFKKGAFHVAIAAKAPIIPVVVSQYNFLDYKFWQFDSGKAVIRVLPAIDTEKYDRAHIDDLIKLAHDQMQDTLQELAVKKDQ